MSVRDFVEGQQVVNQQRKDIGDFLEMVKRFRKIHVDKIDPNPHSYTVKIDKRFTLTTYIDIYRGADWDFMFDESAMKPDSMRIDEINCLHAELPRAVEQLFDNLNLGNEYRAFMGPFINQVKADPWVITVTSRGEKQFVATLEGRHGVVWDAGTTRSEAIAQLLISCQELFNIRIEDSTAEA